MTVAIYTPLIATTLGTLSLGASFLPRFDEAKHIDLVRIVAYTCLLNGASEVCSGIFTWGEKVYARGIKPENSTQVPYHITSIPAFLKTVPWALFESAICGLVLAAAAATLGNTRLKAASAVFTLGIPIAVVIQFITGQSYYYRFRELIPEQSSLERTAQFEVSKYVEGKNRVVTLWRIFSTVLLTSLCIGPLTGNQNPTGRL